MTSESYIRISDREKHRNWQMQFSSSCYPGDERDGEPRPSAFIISECIGFTPTPSGGFVHLERSFWMTSGWTDLAATIDLTCLSNGSQGCCKNFHVLSAGTRCARRSRGGFLWSIFFVYYGVIRWDANDITIPPTRSSTPQIPSAIPRVRSLPHVRRTQVSEFRYSVTSVVGPPSTWDLSCVIQRILNIRIFSCRSSSITP